MSTHPSPHAMPQKPPAPLWARGCGCLVVLVLGVAAVGVAASVLQKGGIGGSTTYTVRVSGDPGTTFTGNYGTVTSDGSSTQKSVQGTVPVDYQVSGSIASAVFQKQSGGAQTLKVQIVKDGAVVKEADTQAAYGAVSVASP